MGVTPSISPARLGEQLSLTINHGDVELDAFIQIVLNPVLMRNTMQNEERVKAELEAILSQPAATEVTDEQLLDLFLALPKKIRDAHFVTTAHVAEIADVSQRTVQLWIESGFIRAISIGKKY